MFYLYITKSFLSLFCQLCGSRNLRHPTLWLGPYQHYWGNEGSLKLWPTNLWLIYLKWFSLNKLGYLMLILGSSHLENEYFTLLYYWSSFILGNVGGDPTQRGRCLALAAYVHMHLFVFPPHVYFSNKIKPNFLT